MPSESPVARSALLVIRHRRGDRAAMNELIALWERPLLYYLRRLLDSEEDAWDVLQETWMRVLRQLPSLRDERAFPAWLYTTGRRLAFDVHRRRRPTEPLPEGGEPELAAPAGPEPSLAGFDAADVHDALARLSLAHRDALTLHFLEGFSVLEIASITATPEGTVKSRLHHARRALRAILEGGQS